MDRRGDNIIHNSHVAYFKSRMKRTSPSRKFSSSYLYESKSRFFIKQLQRKISQGTKKSVNDFSKLRLLSFWQAGVLYDMISESKGKKENFSLIVIAIKEQKFIALKKYSLRAKSKESLLHLTVLIFSSY